MNAIAETVPVFTAAALHHPGGTPHRLVEHVDIDDRHVRIDVYEPPLGGGAHTVLLLHGAGGLLGDGAMLRRAAKHLVACDFRACVVHYFNTTGTLFATQSNVTSHTADWCAAITEISHQYAGTIGEPIGILGYALGGSLAVYAARNHAAEIGAVAVLSGGLPEETGTVNLAPLPPLLVLHGAKDTRIPIDRADALVQLGRHSGAIVESVIYPNEGHALGATAERDAFARTAEFFAARLEAGAEG